MGALDPTMLGDRIAAGLRAFRDVAPVVMHNPRAYPKEAMLLASMTALLALVIFLVVYAILTGIAAWAKRRRLGVNPNRGRMMRIASFAVAALAIVTVVAVLLPYSVRGSKACGGCHVTDVAAATWETGPHASVPCYDCHAGPTAMGGAQVGLVEFSRYLGAKHAGPGATSRRCTSCHGELGRGVRVVDGIRVSHKEIIASGASCLDCHSDVGHERVPSGQEGLRAASTSARAIGDRPMMSRCLTCHDGQRAPSSCPTCHEDGPLDVADMEVHEGSGSIATAVTCRGCHSAKVERACIDCHGLEMPHPAAFRSKHAGMSWDQPDLCVKCHETASATDGCACHEELTIHGTYTEWFPRHSAEARQAGSAGCRCHDETDCETCHTQGAPSWTKVSATQP